MNKINKNRKNYKYKIKLAVMNDFSEGTKSNNLKELCYKIKLRYNKWFMIGAKNKILTKESWIETKLNDINDS